MSETRTDKYEIFDHGKFRPLFNCVVAFNCIYEHDTYGQFEKVLRDTAERLASENQIMNQGCIIRDRHEMKRGFWWIAEHDDAMEAGTVGMFNFDLPRRMRDHMSQIEIERLDKRLNRDE